MDNYRFSADFPRVFRFIVMMFFAVFPRLLLSPLLLRISADLGISYDQASSFFLTSAVGFSLGLITSGFIACRLTHHYTILSGAVMTEISLFLLSTVTSFPLFHLFMGLLSYSNGLYHGSGFASVTRIVPDRFRTRALSFHEMGPNAAFILAPIFSALMAPVLGWRGVLCATGIAAFGAALFFLLSDKGPNDCGAPPNFTSIRLFASVPEYWILLLLIAISVSLATGVFSVLPTYLQVEHNLPERMLNTLIGFSRVTGFASIYLAGHLADRFGYRIVLASILLFTSVLTVLIGFVSGPLLLVVVFLQPAVTQSFFPAALSAVTRIAKPEARNLAVSLAIPLSNILGGGLTPMAFGTAGAAGYFSISFIVLGSLGILSVLLLRSLPAIIRERC